MHQGLDIYMVFGYNLSNNKVILLRKIFFAIQVVSKIFSKKQCYKIDSIEFIRDTYVIRYFYRRERFILTKTATEILQSTELINKFNSRDAAIIGFCVSNPSEKQVKHFRKYFYI